jgi:hypothetical protein
VAHLLPHGPGTATPQGCVLPGQVLIHSGLGLQVLGVPVVRSLVLAAQIQQDGHTEEKWSGWRTGPSHSSAISWDIFTIHMVQRRNVKLREVR